MTPEQIDMVYAVGSNVVFFLSLYLIVSRMNG